MYIEQNERNCVWEKCTERLTNSMKTAVLREVDESCKDNVENVRALFCSIMNNVVLQSDADKGDDFGDIIESFLLEISQAPKTYEKAMNCSESAK